MQNIYVIQLIGVLAAATGMVALTAVSYVYGSPLSRDERHRLGRDSNTRRLPINLETILAGAIFVGGMGILTWSKFNLCGFLSYWIPNIPDAIMFLLSCTR